MAKKKRKRRPHRPQPQRPQGSSAASVARDEVESPAEPGQPASRRQERKEEARRERERRIRQARRRERTRKWVRRGIVIGVLAAVVIVVVLVAKKSSVNEQEAAAAAERLSCTDVEEEQETQPNAHQEPYAHGENGVPAFGGNHVPTPLPQEPKVYQQQPPEEAAVHNLEHGYVLVYYAVTGDNALDPKLVSALEDMVNGETEVLMSPYESLAKPLYLVAWGARQACDPPPDANPQDAVLVARAFIDEWKDGKYAPEPAVP